MVIVKVAAKSRHGLNRIKEFGDLWHIVYEDKNSLTLRSIVGRWHRSMDAIGDRDFIILERIDNEDSPNL